MKQKTILMLLMSIFICQFAQAKPAYTLEQERQFSDSGQVAAVAQGYSKLMRLITSRLNVEDSQDVFTSTQIRFLNSRELREKERLENSFSAGRGNSAVSGHNNHYKTWEVSYEIADLKGLKRNQQVNVEVEVDIYHQGN